MGRQILQLLTVFTALTAACPSIAVSSERHISEGPSFRVVVETAKFDPKGHRMGYRTIEGQRVLLRIDGRDYSGSDGTIPETEITSITVEAEGRRFSVPREAFQSLFNPQLGKNFLSGTPKVINSPKSMTISFRGGDGAGSYGVSFSVDKENLTIERQVNEHPTPERPKVKSFRAAKEPNHTVDPDTRKSGARGSP